MNVGLVSIRSSTITDVFSVVVVVIFSMNNRFPATAPDNSTRVADSGVESFLHS